MLNQAPWAQIKMVEGGERSWPYRSVGQIQFASEEWLRESAIGGDSAIGGVRWPADKLISNSKRWRYDTGE